MAVPVSGQNLDQYNAASQIFDLLDRYLIADLETMARAENKSSGGLGYTMVHVLLSGMGLLGLLLSGGTEENSETFYFFWDNYLARKFPKYGDDDLKKIFRETIRNGTAHMFLVKSGVSVTKERVKHLEEHEGNLNVDVLNLFDDFRVVYEEIKKRTLGDLDPELLNRFDYSGTYRLREQMERSKMDVDAYLAKIASPRKSSSKPVTTPSGVEFMPPHASNVSASTQWFSAKKRSQNEDYGGTITPKL